MNEPSDMVHEAFYTGHVQGVGFRQRTREIAQQHAVHGFVRNLADGRVHVVAAGAAGEVRAFLTAVEQTMRGNIDHVETHELTTAERFSGFTIRH